MMNKRIGKRRALPHVLNELNEECSYRLKILGNARLLLDHQREQARAPPRRERSTPWLLSPQSQKKLISTIGSVPDILSAWKLAGSPLATSEGSTSTSPSLADGQIPCASSNCPMAANLTCRWQYCMECCSKEQPDVRCRVSRHNTRKEDNRHIAAIRQILADAMAQNAELVINYKTGGKPATSRTVKPRAFANEDRTKFTALCLRTNVLKTYIVSRVKVAESPMSEPSDEALACLPSGT